MALFPRFGMEMPATGRYQVPQVQERLLRMSKDRLAGWGMREYGILAGGVQSLRGTPGEAFREGSPEMDVTYSRVIDTSPGAAGG